jgi:hypothetical protein
MSDLRSDLEEITQQFVSAVLEALNSASLSSLAQPAAAGISRATAPSGRRPGRPPKAAPGRPAASAKRPTVGGRRKRASAEEVEKQKGTALATAKGLKPGFSKGDVMRKSGSSVDLGRALTLLVQDGKLVKKGDRRLTRYWVK